MSEIEVEVEEAGERIQELAEAVIRGQHVSITRDGESIALATLEDMTGEAPHPDLKQVVVAVLQGVVNHLRKRPQVTTAPSPRRSGAHLLTPMVEGTSAHG